MSFELVLFLLSEGAPAKPPNGMPIFMLIGVILFFYVLIIRPAKKEQAQKDQMLGGLKKNDKIVTTSGIYGTVVNIQGDAITVRVDDQAKVKIRFVKAAIARVLSPDVGETTAPKDEAKKS
jgi:preprotein translocase subunit YajC